MSGGPWVVKAADAYAVWVRRHDPTPDEKGVVAGWLAEREALGPPNDALADDRGNWTATTDEHSFYFRCEDLGGQDPAGYIFVMTIT